VRVFEKTDYNVDERHGRGHQTGIRARRARRGGGGGVFPEFNNRPLTGRPALGSGRDADHRSAISRRLRKIVALIAVFIGLVVLLRSIWLAVAAEISACWSASVGRFGLGDGLAVGELNLPPRWSSSSRLIGIGNGLSDPGA